MARTFMLLHIIGLSLGLGGLLAQMILLAKYQRSADSRERFGSERMAESIIALVQAPGVYLSLLTGIGLAWLTAWDVFSEGWLHFKILFFFWILLATRMMGKNMTSIRTLRAQCGDDDSERLLALKDNHRMIGYVTLLTFLFVLVFSFWKPL